MDIEVLEPVDRCRAVNLTPGTSAWNPDDINVHMKRHYGHNNLGLLCSCVTPGTFKVGDSISILR